MCGECYNLGKLIGLLFLFCPLPPLYFVLENSKNTRNELAHPVMNKEFLQPYLEQFLYEIL